MGRARAAPGSRGRRAAPRVPEASFPAWATGRATRRQAPARATVTPLMGTSAGAAATSAKPATAGRGVRCRARGMRTEWCAAGTGCARTERASATAAGAGRNALSRRPGRAIRAPCRPCTALDATSCAPGQRMRWRPAQATGGAAAGRAAPGPATATRDTVGRHAACGAPWTAASCAGAMGCATRSPDSAFARGRTAGRRAARSARSPEGSRARGTARALTARATAMRTTPVCPATPRACRWTLQWRRAAPTAFAPRLPVRACASTRAPPGTGLATRARRVRSGGTGRAVTCSVSAGRTGSSAPATACASAERTARATGTLRAGTGAAPRARTAAAGTSGRGASGSARARRAVRAFCAACASMALGATARVRVVVSQGAGADPTAATAFPAFTGRRATRSARRRSPLALIRWRTVGWGHATTGRAARACAAVRRVSRRPRRRCRAPPAPRATTARTAPRARACSPEGRRAAATSSAMTGSVGAGRARARWATVGRCARTRARFPVARPAGMECASGTGRAGARATPRSVKMGAAARAAVGRGERRATAPALSARTVCATQSPGSATATPRQCLGSLLAQPAASARRPTSRMRATCRAHRAVARCVAGVECAGTGGARSAPRCRPSSPVWSLSAARRARR